MALTTKQQIFVQEYLVDFNATRSALAAGYSKASAYSIGSANLQKPEIMEAIKKETGKQLKKAEVSVEYVLETLVSTIKRCQEDENFNPAAVFKGCELLGKYLKMYTDKVEHTGKDGEDLFESMNDNEVARRVAFLLTKPGESQGVH